MRIGAALRTGVEEQSRWPSLDGIRGFAIVAVFAYHAFKLAGGWTSSKIRGEGVPLWGWPLGGGRLGVDLFFVLSGFLLWFSWRSIRRRNPAVGASLREYAWGRAVRILPPYWVMLAVTIPLLAPELLQSAEGLWHTLLFFTTQQYNEPSLPGQLNVVLWTLTVEVHFYVLLPLVALVMLRARAQTAVAVSLLVGLWWFWNRGAYPESTIIGRADQFVMGMAAAAVVGAHLDGRASALSRAFAARATPWLAAAGIAVLWLYHGSTFGLPRGNAIEPYLHPLMAALFCAVVAHLALAPHSTGSVRRTLERPWARLAGHLSYGIYLWHFPAILVVDEQLPDAATVTRGAAVLALTAATTLASWFLVERPFLALKDGPRTSAPAPPRQPVGSARP
ncbi:MAG TPA: acyltransferase [Acidimicrobiia bacterium]|nr:acyltransferase [Acidimicrobiia bacterium]